MVTLKDIAARANVSISTVSKVINGGDINSVSKETLKKIWEIANEEGYIPNKYARNLSAVNKSKTIGCILSSTHETYKTSFFNRISNGIHDEIEKQEYTLGYAMSSSNTLKTVLYENIASKEIESAIILGRFKKEFLEFLKQNIKNLVYAGLNPINKGIDEVICDAFESVSCAVEHLISLGYRKIAYVGTVPDYTVVNECRFNAYKYTLEKNRLEFDNRLVSNVELSTEEGYEAMKKMLNDGNIPTAVFCGNDTTAIGVMRAVCEKELHIPRDIAVISIDDIDMASYIRPALSTINVPKEELGRFAVKLLIDKIESKRVIPVRVNIPFKLVVRESCGGQKPY